MKKLLFFAILFLFSMYSTAATKCRMYDNHTLAVAAKSTYCTSASAWAGNACSSQSPLEGILSACKTKSTSRTTWSYGYRCTGSNYFYDSSCHLLPEVILTPQEQCVADGNYWYNNQCNTSPDNNLTPQEQCVADGDYWYNNQCNDLPEIRPPAHSFTDQISCESNNWFWYNNQCNDFQEVVDPDTNVDPYSCSTPDPIASFYAPVYPDGISKVWDDKKQDFENQPILDVLELNLPASGSSVELSLNFDIGSNMNFGNSKISIPDYIFTFIRLCILITAAWTCRALIFGG